MTSANHPTTCCCDAPESDGDLPLNPFEALRASFGMSLGEGDFRVLVGYPRGKLMLHQAWLHGSGVVWGLVPEVRKRPTPEGGEVSDIWVTPGLAVDGLGRELHIEADQCVPLTDWLDRHQDDVAAKDCTVPIRGTLVAHFAGCLSRLVPAVADPCDVNRRRNDYSRVVEAVRFTIEDTTDPKQGYGYQVSGYSRVRAFLGLDVSNADDIVAARVAVAEEPYAKRPHVMLKYLNKFAAEDVAELTAAADANTGQPMSYPADEDESGVVLGGVEALIIVGAGRPKVRDLKVTQEYPRPVLLPTRVLQDLVCALAPDVIRGTRRADKWQDAGGPRLDSEIIWADDMSFRFTVSSPLAVGSQERGIEVSTLSDADRGWSREEVESVELSDDARTVTVQMKAPVDFETRRVIIRGTGRFPLVGANGVPFAGRTGGPPGSLDDGHDAVITQWSEQRRAAQPPQYQRSAS
jgi:hypothetical protein